VVTLVVTNPDDISVAEYWGQTFVQSGIVPYAYVPPNGNFGPGLGNWPTLGMDSNGGGGGFFEFAFNVGLRERLELF
jgi:hypothetical protein